MIAVAKLGLSLFCLLCLYAGCCNSTTEQPQDEEISIESKLVQDILTRYRRLNPHRVRPVFNSSHSLLVSFGIGLVQLLDFNEKDQMMHSLVWKQYAWKDEFIGWKPEDYDGVKNIVIACEKIWTPDIVLYNNAGDAKVEEHKTAVVVNYEGQVSWIPAVKYTSSCPIDMTYFPFDVQSCILRFGSWSHNALKVDMVNMNPNGFDLKNYVNNSEFAIEDEYVTPRILKVYPCCPEPYAEILFTLELRRQVTFHMRLIMVPTVLLSIMSCAIFWIPPNRPDRTTVGLGLFSAFFLLLISVLNTSPPVPESKLGQYYVIVILIVSFGVMFSVLIINVFTMEKKIHPWVDKILQCIDQCTCKEQKQSKRRLSKGGTKDVERSPSVRTAAVHPSVPTPQDKAKWQRFASILDKTVFFITAFCIVISYITVFPDPTFIFTH